MIRIIKICILFLLVLPLEAQQPGYLEMSQAEKELEQLFSQLYSDTLPAPDPVLERISSRMGEVLVMEGAMAYPWSRLNMIGRIRSDDGQVQIFTWHVKDNPDSFRYFGFVQIAQRRGRIKVYELQDNGKAQRNLTNLEQSVENWCGKLYYSILTTQHKRATYYTLLGMDFNNSRSVIKTIESVSVDRQKPYFEKELFFNGTDKTDRVVLEYSNQVSISVRYDPGIDMITYDHLEPLNPVYTSNYEFYTPSGSYDGLEFTDGIWVLHEDVDARNRD